MSLLAKIRAGEPWAVSDLLYGFDEVHDTDGRPLGERRAPSAAKAGVEMELRPCPYHDSREGLPMHVSALRQVMGHFEAASADVVAFHGELSNQIGGLDRLICGVLDLLVAPGLWLLANDGPLPSRLAVGYKLAAGFFSAVRDYPNSNGLSDAELLESLLTYVSERRLLHGASEVCAGPPNLIRDSAAALIGAAALGGKGSTPRGERARLLAVQVRLASAFRAFDAAFERWLLCDLPAGALMPVNSFMQREVQARRHQIEAARKPLAPVQLLPETLCGADLQRIMTLFADTSPRQTGELEANESRSALKVDPAVRANLWARFSQFRAVYLELAKLQDGFERQLRAGLGKVGEGRVGFSELALPVGRSRRWVDAALGRPLVAINPAIS